MRVKLVFLFSLLPAAALLLSAGCDSGGDQVAYVPDEVDLSSLWIDGYYRCFPAGNPWAPIDNAIVLVRKENDAGIPVSDVTVRIGGQTLVYDGKIQAYTGPGVDLSAGEELTLVVGNGVDSVSAAVTVPRAPANLFLAGDTWDISGPEIENTLRWTPPDTLGEHLVVYLYTSARGENTLVWYGRTDHPESDYLTLYNHEIPYFSAMPSVTAIVCQANYALFEGNPAFSAFTVLGCAWGSWATTAAKGRRFDSPAMKRAPGPPSS